MKLLLLSFLVSFSFFTMAKDIEFNSEDSLNAISMSGVVSVRCNNGQYPTSQILRCYSSFLENGNYQKLKILTSDKTDSVSLFNVTTGRKKTVKVNSSTNTTSKAINLWVESLTQRALVNYGVNEIQYTLNYKGQEVASGVYNVDVVKSEQRRCPNGFLYYSNSFCPSAYTACSDYFYRYRYCK